MITVKELNSGYGKGEVVKKVDLTLAREQVVALIGPNGAGKTTLLKSIVNLIPEISGEINLNDQNIKRLNTHELLKMGIAYVPEGRGIFLDMTVYENLRLGSLTAKKDFRQNLQKVYSIFPKLEKLSKQKGATLSGGEQQMLAVARGLMSNPRYLLIDEPSLGLAPNLVVEMFEFLRGIAKQDGVAILLSEQNQSVLDVADEIYVLVEGQIVKKCHPSNITTDELFQLYIH